MGDGQARADPTWAETQANAIPNARRGEEKECASQSICKPFHKKSRSFILEC
jgi:hypothetical protein